MWSTRPNVKTIILGSIISIKYLIIVNGNPAFHALHCTRRGKITSFDSVWKRSFFFISFICSYDGASKSTSWQIIPKAKTNLIVGNKFWQRNPRRLTKNYNIQHAEIKFISFWAFFTEINQTVTRLQRLTILKMEWFHFCGVQHKLLLNHIDICVCFVFCNEKSLAYNLQHTKVNEDDLHEKKNRAAFHAYLRYSIRTQQPTGHHCAVWKVWAHDGNYSATFTSVSYRTVPQRHAIFFRREYIEHFFQSECRARTTISDIVADCNIARQGTKVVYVVHRVDQCFCE